MPPSSQKLLQNPEALCNMTRRIAVEAGDIIMWHFEDIGDLQIEPKSDGSPVSLADREAEEFIYAKLKQLTPEIPIIGEEAASQDALPDLKNAEYFWLVDPLDGTKEFVSGGSDFTVNIALIKNGMPVMGVVYAPAKDLLYAGYGPDTAIRWNADTDHEKSIHVRRPPKEGITVVASSRHGDPARMEKFLQDYKVEKLLKQGSSLKICIIAEGKADLYPRLGPTCEWDTAAAQAVLESAGGMVTDLQGQALQYGGADPKFLNPEFVAASFEWFSAEESA